MGNKEYAMSASVRLFLDPEDSSYKVETVLHLSDDREVINPDNISSDLVLAIADELSKLKKKIMTHASLTNKDMKEYLEDRPTVSENDFALNNPDILENLFDDES